MEENIALILAHAQQIDNFLVSLNLCLQITLGTLLGYKLGEA